MSGNIRIIGLVSTVALGSWVGVRALAAPRVPMLDDPPIALTATSRLEVRDDGLAETIHRFATLARAPRAPLAAR
jgi:hypothetical protein